MMLDDNDDNDEIEINFDKIKKLFFKKYLIGILGIIISFVYLFMSFERYKVFHLIMSLVILIFSSIDIIIDNRRK